MSNTRYTLAPANKYCSKRNTPINALIRIALLTREKERRGHEQNTDD